MQILTTCRSDFGLLENLIRKTGSKVIVTGAHLSSDFGSTGENLQGEKIEILSQNVSKTMGNALILFDDYFKKNPEPLLVLGDRHETLAVALAAYNLGVEIIHLYGGDTTLGSKDNAYRHSISHLASLHLVGSEKSAERVRELTGSDKIFVVGLLGHEIETVGKMELEEELNLKLDLPYFVVCVHPPFDALRLKEILRDKRCIFINSNADDGGREINEVLGGITVSRKTYLSLLKYSKGLIGNSSSGLTEAPCFGIQTFNIGSRQEGREKPESVLDLELEDLGKAIKNPKRFTPVREDSVTDKIIKVLGRFYDNCGSGSKP